MVKNHFFKKVSGKALGMVLKYLWYDFEPNSTIFLGGVGFLARAIFGKKPHFGPFSVGMRAIAGSVELVHTTENCKKN